MTRPERIFVLDDEPGVRKALERLLRIAGWDVATFATAADFLAAVEAAPPGCMVLDYQMPGMNGLELLEILAARGLQGRIVFLSGSADIPPAARAAPGGAAAFLAKPAASVDLLAAVKRALQG